MLAVVLVLLVAAAGCLGDSKAKHKEGGASPAQATFNKDTGGIAGTVSSKEEPNPIEDVQVGLLGQPDRQTRTDAQGRYALSNVAPGHVQLLFSKVGFESLNVPIDVEAGAVVTKDVELVRLPVPKISNPYGEYGIPKVGSIGCGVGALGQTANQVFGRDFCGAVTNAGKSTNIVTFQRRATDNLTGYVLSGQWQRSSIATGANQLKFHVPVLASQWPKAVQCQKRCYLGGPGIIEARDDFVFVIDTHDPYVPAWSNDPANPTLSFAVEISNGNFTDSQTWGGAVFQQTFTVQVYLMYNGAPAKTEHLWE